MKYIENKNEPMICMMTQNLCYRGTTKMPIRGILWHSTGANNPTLKRYVQPDDDATNREEIIKIIGKNKYNNDFNHIDRLSGVNAWIGKLADGSVTTIQVMPWDYKPWGCGSGQHGSCNDGWIQFEICEDNLANKDYFNTVYDEAIQLTAYLCKKYNLDPEGTVKFNGINVPVILCHADSYRLGVGHNHGDVYHWFKLYDKTMEDVRKDVVKLLEVDSKQDVPVKEIFRIRKSWDDPKSQKGAFTDFKAAIIKCNEYPGHCVFNSKGNPVYPASGPVPEKKQPIAEAESVKKFSVGDTVSLVSNAKYSSGANIPSWVFNKKLYIINVRGNGDYVISTDETGKIITGIVKSNAVKEYTDVIPVEPNFSPYIIRITTNSANVHENANTSYKITAKVKKGDAYTIVAEKNGWGRLKSGIGWVELKNAKKL